MREQTQPHTLPPYVLRGARWRGNKHKHTHSLPTSREGSDGEGTHTPSLRPARGQPVREQTQPHTPSLRPARDQPVREQTQPHSLPTSRNGSAGEGTNTTTHTPSLRPARGQPVREQTQTHTLPPYVPRGVSR